MGQNALACRPLVASLPHGTQSWALRSENTSQLQSFGCAEALLCARRRSGGGALHVGSPPPQSWCFYSSVEVDSDAGRRVSFGAGERAQTRLLCTCCARHGVVKGHSVFASLNSHVLGGCRGE